MALGWVGRIAVEHGVGFIGNMRVSPEMRGTISPREDALVSLSAGAGLPGYVFGFGGPLPDDADAETLHEALAGKLFFEQTYPRWPPPATEVNSL